MAKKATGKSCYDHLNPCRCADYTPEEVEFMMAMDHYKRSHQRPYPTWKEVLEVLRSLGWRKVAEAK